MWCVEPFSDAGFFEGVVPGALIKVRARYDTDHGGPPGPEEDPELGLGGEALVASEGDGGSFWVSYLKLRADDSEPRGWRAEVLYQEERPEEFYCGEVFGELEAQLMPRLGSIEPPEDLAGKRAWFEAKMGVLERRAREAAARELLEEARLLRAGELPHPPEEGLLGPVLRELGRV